MKKRIYLILILSIFIISCKERKLGSDYKVDKVKSEIDLYQYKPFTNSELLYTFEEAPSLVIDKDYPKLDGATAAYPIYAAIVQEIYKGLDEINIEEYVTSSKTPEAYERLINKEVDAIFVAEPSKAQLELAKQSGVELELIPISKEAFVFFVNKDNIVNGLTVQQIQDIYTKKITNWKKVGGNSKKILAFQRPENSGSQTIMENVVMKDIKMAKPLEEEYSQLMGEIVEGVADYRNYKESIGYSFRYYTTAMKKNDSIKLLSINGIEPTVENIKSNKYPYTVSVYLVTRKDVKNKNLDALIEWILSDEGQSTIEKMGYVPTR